MRYLLAFSCSSPSWHRDALHRHPRRPPRSRSLKYLLLDHYGEDGFFFCDPDYYPISRGDEQAKAIETFPATRNSTDEFDAILNRTGLQPPFSDEAKLTIYREHKRLQAIPLTPATADSFT